MDVLSLAGEFLAIASVSAAGIQALGGTGILEQLRFQKKGTQKLQKDHGWLTAYLLLLCFPEALAVMQRVEQYVLRTGKSDAILFKDSFSSRTNMIAIAVRRIAFSFPLSIGVYLISFPGSYHRPSRYHCTLLAHVGPDSLDCAGLFYLEWSLRIAFCLLLLSHAADIQQFP